MTDTTHPSKPVAASKSAGLRALFEARSIALIGASADPTKLGSSPLVAMEVLGYVGEISIVNPRYDELRGHRCYPSIADLPDGIEAAMVILPAPAAVEAVEALADRGVKAVVVIPQGFGESGPEGLPRDERLLAVAARGVAIVGPNTNGMANVATGLAMSIAPTFVYAGNVRPGSVSVISQSGAMVSSLLTYVERCGLGVGKSITCGNELCLNVADYLDYLVDDPDTDVIILYLETIRDMAAFRAALAHARRAGKPIVAIKVGESEGGQKATLSHTGAIAGSYRNIITFLESEGVYVADDLESLAMIAECLHRYDWSADDAPAKPFIASISGGFAAMTADEMGRLGMVLEDPSADGAAHLTALPTQSHAVNPYDIAAQNQLIPDIIRIFREDGFNQLLFGLVMLKPEILEQVAQILFDAKRAGMERLFAISPRVTEDDRARFNAEGILITDNTVALLKALRAIERHRRLAAQRAAGEHRPADATATLPASAGLVDEARSKAIVEELGIRTPQNRVFRVADGLGDIAGLSRPLVMKGLSETIAHKSEHGLVALNLVSDDDARSAWDRIAEALAKADPAATEILVEEMIGSGLEAILGVQRDATVGPVVVVGAGGILVELLADAAVLVPPFSPMQARAAILETRFGRLMTGYRGRHFDLEALAQAASQLGDFALNQARLESVDINPVLVQPDAGGLIAVDAKVFVGD
jgi:acyl-CoA synthetase (NDP forming)